jgi:hypothetical protein
MRHAEKVRSECAECGKEMWQPQCRVGIYLRCSQACHKAWRDRSKLVSKQWYDTRFTLHPTKVQVACLECQRPMWLPPSKVAQYQRCGAACTAIQQERLKAERERVCASCGVVFHPRKRQLRMGGGRYCSQQCHGEGNRQDKARTKFPNRKGIAPSVIQAIGEAQRWRCAICRADISKGHEKDHITPLSRGGKHEARNIQLTCRPCNLDKRAKDPIAYMQSLGRLL